MLEHTDWSNGFVENITATHLTLLWEETGQPDRRVIIPLSRLAPGTTLSEGQIIKWYLHGNSFTFEIPEIPAVTRRERNRAKHDARQTIKVSKRATAAHGHYTSPD